MCDEGDVAKDGTVAQNQAIVDNGLVGFIWDHAETDEPGCARDIASSDRAGI